MGVAGRLAEGRFWAARDGGGREARLGRVGRQPARPRMAPPVAVRGSRMRSKSGRISPRTSTRPTALTSPPPARARRRKRRRQSSKDGSARHRRRAPSATKPRRSPRAPKLSYRRARLSRPNLRLRLGPERNRIRAPNFLSRWRRWATRLSD